MVLVKVLVNTNKKAGAGELLAMACAGGEVGPGRRAGAAEVRRLNSGLGTGCFGGFLMEDEIGWMRIAESVIFLMTKET